MHRLAIAPRPLAVGQSMTLPNGAGKITFTGYRQWISLAITYDPGQLPGADLRRARPGRAHPVVHGAPPPGVRPGRPGPDGRTLVEVGGLARSDAAGGFEVEFAELTAELRTAQDGSPAATSPDSASPAADAAAAGTIAQDTSSSTREGE